MSETLRGLPPVINKKTKVLILGSFPGKQSLEKQEYYGNRRNYFWQMIFKVLKENDPQDYKKRIQLLQKKGIGLWDVVCCCSRINSEDSKIRQAKINDISKVLNDIKNIKAVFFNGKTAEKLFRQEFKNKGIKVYLQALPSTSPANAGQTFEFKYSKWRKIKEFLAKIKNKAMG
jgi:hypoxanthine-DNA glycosylase